MYEVTEAYVTSLESSHIASRVEGMITLKSGQTISFTEKEIVPGSLCVNNRCTNNGTFSLGSVYVGEMQVSLLVDIDRYALFNAKVDLSVFHSLSEGGEEKIPIGTFYVNDAKRTRKIVALTCYDAMTNFDVELESSSTGTAYDLLAFICEKCDVEMAQTPEEIAEFVNSAYELVLDTEKIGTYRDALAYITAVLAGFATIDRMGKLRIGTFHTTQDRTITARRRMSATIADYHTFIGGVKCRFFANDNYYPYTEVNPIVNDGLLIDLGDNPVVQGTDEYKHAVLQNILQKLVAIEYVPVELSITPDPSLEVGDGVFLEDVNGTKESVFSIITSLTWKFHKEMEVISEGGNTKLESVTSKEAKAIQQLESAEFGGKGLTVKTFANAKRLKLNHKDTIIISLSFSAYEECEVVFIGTVPVEMDMDGNVVFTYYKAGIQREVLTQYLERGKHIVTLSNYFKVGKDEGVKIVVKARTEYFKSDKRQNDAKIAALVDFTSTGNYVETAIDETIPGGLIEPDTIRAMIFSTGVNTTVAWDGTFEYAESLDTEFELDALYEEVVLTGQFSENIQPAFVPHKDIVLNSTVVPFQLLNLEEIEVNSLQERSNVFPPVVQQTVHFSLNAYTKEEEGVVTLNDTYVYQSYQETVDEGAASMVQIWTSDKTSVESVEMVYE